MTSLECSFCGKSFKQTEYHDCANKIFSVLNSSASIKKDQTKLFQDIDNMVFQGGGVKGLGYLGVMNQLLSENPNIFKNLKRVAGNSAGSITALYIALNLDYEDIKQLMMTTNYEQLLDDGIYLKVAYNIEDYLGDYKYKNFKVVDVVFEAKFVLTQIIQEIKAKPTFKAPQEKLQTMIYNMIRYYGSKLSFSGRTGLNALSKTIAQYAAKLLISFLTSDVTIAPNLKVESLFRSSPPQDDQQPDPEPAPEPEFQPDLLKASENHAHESDPYLERTITEIVDAAYDQYESEAAVQNHPLLFRSNGAENEKAPDAQKLEKDTVNFYFSQLQQTVENVHSRSELVGPDLNYALGELLWFILVSQTDYSGFRQNLGLFTGNRIQEELLEGAIKLKFKKLGKEKDYQKDFTFKQLADLTDSSGKKLFKPFYVTAYNPLNNATEVFSVEHTPNAVACQAVRASMSIPVFFQPAPITENGQPRVVHSAPPGGSTPMEVVHYMDGGILDNYPLFIFDDLKYCVAGELPTWVPQKKIAVQNPRTLGFRLLSAETIPKYEKPYYDKEQTQRKKLGEDYDKNDISFVAKTLLKGFLSSENEFLKYGNCPRSVFVSDLGFSATAFDLTSKDKEALIESGRNAVKDYKKRAQTNFVGEGEKYVSQVAMN